MKPNLICESNKLQTCHASKRKTIKRAYNVIKGELSTAADCFIICYYLMTTYVNTY